MSGKGSTQRPTDKKKFDEGWERIFGKKKIEEAPQPKVPKVPKQRKLASIKRIAEIRLIPGANQICSYRVDGWWVVDKLFAHSVGDLVVYLEVDSWVPHSLAPFLSGCTAPREFNGVKGERLRTVRLRGQLSQGLLLNRQVVLDRIGEISEGMDVGDLLGIQKWEAPIPAQLAGEMKGAFPSFIRKTDQERIQNLVQELQDWNARDLTWEVTEKLDGSSGTFYMRDGEFGACSRNLELREIDTNTFWKVARQARLEEILRADGRNLALQGEVIGEGIQGNRYGIKGHDFYVFDIYDIDAGRYLVSDARQQFCAQHGLKHVPVIETARQLGGKDVDALLQLAEGPTVMSSAKKGTEREGYVYKCRELEASFKTISNRFLLKSGD
jgi:RNA ligase (TIGR02306 family)